MNVEDEEWVQHALKDFERKRCISKVLSVDCENAVPIGNNYGSDMFRLRLKTVLYSGEIVNKSFIYKVLPATEARRKLLKDGNLQTTEMRMYVDFLPEIEKIRQENNLERLSPIFYGMRGRNVGYLLEDLNAIGYKMADRLKGLDYQHGEVAIKTLAEFHALSLVLIERGDFVVDEWKESFFVDHPGIVDGMIIASFDALEECIREKWEPEWLIYAEKLKEYSKTMMTRFVEELRFNENNFNVILHGDYWTNNMMFRYDSDGIPQTGRLIDFQLSHYNNAGIDLQYFFYTSLTAEALVRKDELLQLYCESLKSSLSRYGIPEKTPTYEAVLESYHRAKEYGFAVGLGFKPLIMQPTDGVPKDLEEWTKDFMGDSNKKAAAPKIDLEKMRSVLEIILKEGSSAGIL